MAASSFSTPFQSYVYQYQNSQESVTPFQILGGEAQIVQIMLKSQEKVTAKPGTMCYTSGSIQVDSIYFPDHEGSIWQWLFGKSVARIALLNTGIDVGFVGIAAPSPARILPIDLANFDGEIFCQPDAFLCSVNDVTVTNTFHRRAQNVVTGAEVILKQRLTGQGLAFLAAGGSVAQKVLEEGEVLIVDVACIIAMTSSIGFRATNPNPIRGVVLGGEKQLTASLTGPGVVFIQSLPFQRLSRCVVRSFTPPGMRENQKLILRMTISFFLVYLLILSIFPSLA